MKQTPASHPEMEKCIRCGAPCCVLDECDERYHFGAIETDEGWLCGEYCQQMLYEEESDQWSNSSDD